MNTSNISEILPNLQQQKIPHFIEIKRPKQNIQIYQSKSYFKIFYQKKNMRQLLDERTELCLFLGLTSSRKQNKTINKELVSSNFSLLFEEGPSKLNEISWAIIQDRGTIYGFLATDDKYVPCCKSCSSSIYLTLRYNNGRIICSNKNCKLKLLNEFQLVSKVNQSNINNSQMRQSKKSNSRLLQQINEAKEQKDLSLKQIDMIKKAAKKIVS